jgi:hypothetical protein
MYEKRTWETKNAIKKTTHSSFSTAARADTYIVNIGEQLRNGLGLDKVQVH